MTPDRADLAAAHRRSQEAAQHWRASAAYRIAGAAFASVPSEAEALADAAKTPLSGDDWIGDLIAPLLADDGAIAALSLAV